MHAGFRPHSRCEPQAMPSGSNPSTAGYAKRLKSFNHRLRQADQDARRAMARRTSRFISRVAQPAVGTLINAQPLRGTLIGYQT